MRAVIDRLNHCLIDPWPLQFFQQIPGFIDPHRQGRAAVADLDPIQYVNHVGLLPGDLQLRNRECASSQIADIPGTVLIGKSPGRAGMDVAIDSHLIGSPLKRLQYLYNWRGLANGSRHICNGEIPDGPDLIAHFDCLNSCGQIRAQRRAARKRHLVESLFHCLELPHQHDAIEENESAIAVVIDGLAEVCFFFLALVSEDTALP